MKAPRPLAKVLLRNMVVAYLIFAAILTSAELYFEHRNARQEITRTLEWLANTFAPGAANALWDYQHDLLRSLAVGIGEHPMTVAVEIRDLQGRMSADYQTDHHGQPSTSLVIQKTLYHHTEGGHKEALGTLRIASSEAILIRHLQDQALAIGLWITAQLIFLGGILVVLMRRLIVAPLTDFSGEVRQRMTDQWQQPIDVGRIEIAEIALLQQGFNQLLGQIADHQASIDAANAELEQRIAERTLNLDQRNQELVQEHALILALVHSFPGFVCVLRDTGQILMANSPVELLMGHPGVDLTGQPWQDLLSQSRADHPLLELFEDIKKTGRSAMQASLADSFGQERVYQFEGLRIGGDTEARIMMVGVDVTKQHREKLHLQHQAFHDRLTGLPNRALLLERLEQTIVAATRQKASFGLAFVDLDHFKPINDSAGHEAGDAVLREIANRLRQCVRESDTVARHGGDEFVLLLLSSTEQGLQRIANAVLNAVTQPIAWRNTQFMVSASIGLAIFPQDGNNIKQLLDAADTAMYRAKQAGRNRADFVSRPGTS
ncbi:MAG: hypothetical protein QG599_1950 [Pseudomonadota bacterium]|nr:hypothetical protein [Pseudomonadota bacterium]